MKKIIIALFAVALPFVMQAQSEGLFGRKTPKGAKADLSAYAAKGAVPEENGKVVFKDVMMEGEVNKGIHAFMKGADYLDASMECVRNIIAGSRDYNFYRAFHDLQKKIDAKKVVVTAEAQAFYHMLMWQIEPIKESLIYYDDCEYQKSDDYRLWLAARGFNDALND